MLRKNPGIDIPVATEAKILHAAAFLEFKQYTEGLVDRGLRTAGYTCWMHAVEIRHSPYVGPTTSESEYFPPLLMPCCAANCERCAAHLGGFKFRWLGLWSSRGIVVPPGLSPADAWSHYYAHRDEKLDLILLAAYSTGVEPEEMVPQDLYASWGWVSFSLNGASGKDAFRKRPSRLDSWILGGFPGQAGGDPGRLWDALGTERFELRAGGWKPNPLGRWCWAQVAWNVVTSLLGMLRRAMQFVLR